MDKEETFTLCLQGGGARGIYSAGVMDAFLHEKLFASEVYGCSASAILGRNYLSKEEGRSIKEALAITYNPRFLKILRFLFGGSLFEFSYLLEKLPKKRLPFDENAFLQNPCKFYVNAVSLKEGTICYFEKSNPLFKQCVAASSSLLPFAKPTQIGEELYVDGGYLESIPFLKPLAENKRKIIVVLTKERGFKTPLHSEKQIRSMRKRFAKYPTFCEIYEKQTTQRYNEHLRLLEKLHQEGRIYLIAPSIAPNVHATTQNRKKIKALYNLGKEDAFREINDIKKYLCF